MSADEPAGEELRAALEEELRRVSVGDVLLQTVVTLVNLGGRRLGLASDGPEDRNLDQARLAIEAIRALLPLVPGDQAPPIKDALAQLQLAFARESQGQGGVAEGAPAEREKPGEAPEPGGPKQDEAERQRRTRAAARSKIWTPPGA